MYPTQFRVREGDGNWDPETWSEDDIIALVGEFESCDVYKYTGTNAHRLRIPYMMTGSFTRQNVTVYFASQQQYRWKVVQWLDDDNNVLGYTYVYGKNGPLSCEITTESKPEPAASDTPYVIGQDMTFTCELFPQEGAEDERYFEFHVSGTGCEDHDGAYTVYVPYSYFGMTGYEQARKLKNRPMIYHYYDGVDRLKEDGFAGTYTPHGVCFHVGDFSPFVIKCDLTPASSMNIPANASPTYHAPTTVTAKAPDTADPGIALYTVTAFTSLTGGAWLISRKKH